MVDEKWEDALDRATSSRCGEYMGLSPRVANAMVGASEFQTRLLQKLQEKFDYYPQPVAEENSPIVSPNAYREIMKLVENLEPRSVPMVKHSTTIKNGCPECGGDIFDGTGTGWVVCTKCNYMA